MKYLYRGLLVVLVLIGHVLFALGDLTEVSIVESEDRDFIRNLFQDKFYDPAAEEAQEYLIRYPTGFFRAEVIFILAQIDVFEERYSSALKRNDQIIKEYPTSSYMEESLYLAGTLSIQLGHLDKGSAYLARLLKNFPETILRDRLQYPLGIVAYNKKEWNIAQKQFLLALELKELPVEHRLESQRLLAWSYHFQDKKKLAAKNFAQLLSSGIKSRSKSKIAFQLAVYAQDKKDYRRAISFYRKQMELWPSPEFQHRSRFWIAESLFLISQDPSQQLNEQEKKEGVHFFTDNLALKNSINPVISRYHRGWLNQDLKQYAEVEKDFRWLQENVTEYFNDRNLTIIRAGNFEKQEKWLQANEVYLPWLQKNSESELWLQVFRNYYRAEKCSALIGKRKLAGLSFPPYHINESSYYLGKCYLLAGKDKEAKVQFSKIALGSSYGQLIFNDYLKLIQKSEEYGLGIKLLEQGIRIFPKNHFEELLTIKMRFHRELKQWGETLLTIQQLIKLKPDKNNDPWLLLILAQVHDHLSKEISSSDGKRHPATQSKEYHAEEALKWYLRVYGLLPVEKVETRLSILDALDKIYGNEGNYARAVEIYIDGLNLISEKQHKDEIHFQIAKFYFRQLQNLQQAKIWFSKLHLQGEKDLYFESSQTLAEILIEEEDYKGAIKILEELSQKKLLGPPWYVSTHFRLGELYQAQEQWKKALIYYTNVVKSKEENSLKQTAKKHLFAIKKYLQSKANNSRSTQK